MPRYERYYSQRPWLDLASSQARINRAKLSNGRPTWVKEKERENIIAVYLVPGVALEFGGLLLGTRILMYDCSHGPAEGALIVGANCWCDEDGSLTIKRLARDPVTDKWTWQVAARLEPWHWLEAKNHKGQVLKNPVICLRCRTFSGKVLKPDPPSNDKRTGRPTPADPFVRYQCPRCERIWPGGLTKEARRNKRH